MDSSLNVIFVDLEEEVRLTDLVGLSKSDSCEPDEEAEKASVCEGLIHLATVKGRLWKTRVSGYRMLITKPIMFRLQEVYML